MKTALVTTLFALLALLQGCSGISGVTETSAQPSGTSSSGSGASGGAGSSSTAPAVISTSGGAAAALKYCSPGDLKGSNEAGHTGRAVYFPYLGFPMEFAPATQLVTGNSQMYNPGGYCSSGVCNGQGGGSACTMANFAPPWRDTFCEEAGRTYGTALCPDGRGHQGLDIRPPVQITGETSVCRRDHWFAVAVIDGTVSRASGAVVEFIDDQGRRFVYRHMNPSSIQQLGIVRGKTVRKGQRIGRVDQYNNSGTERYTTLHLHLEGLAQGEGGATNYYPLYTSVIAAYRRAVGLPSLVDSSGRLGIDSARELVSGCG